MKNKGYMSNPFELISARLEAIECLIKEIHNSEHGKKYLLQDRNRVLMVDEAAALTGLAKSSLYKKTAAREIPHYKKGKRLYFDREELEKYMMENQNIKQ